MSTDASAGTRPGTFDRVKTASGVMAALVGAVTGLFGIYEKARSEAHEDTKTSYEIVAPEINKLKEAVTELQKENMELRMIASGTTRFRRSPADVAAHPVAPPTVAAHAVAPRTKLSASAGDQPTPAPVGAANQGAAPVPGKPAAAAAPAALAAGAPGASPPAATPGGSTLAAAPAAAAPSPGPGDRDERIDVPAAALKRVEEKLPVDFVHAAEQWRKVHKSE